MRKANWKCKSRAAATQKVISRIARAGNAYRSAGLQLSRLTAVSAAIIQFWPIRSQKALSQQLPERARGQYLWYTIPRNRGNASSGWIIERGQCAVMDSCRILYFHRDISRANNGEIPPGQRCSTIGRESHPSSARLAKLNGPERARGFSFIFAEDQPARARARKTRRTARAQLSLGVYARERRARDVCSAHSGSLFFCSSFPCPGVECACK